MSQHKRTPDEIERDRAAIARRILHGETQAEIAASLNVSRQQVGYDLKIVRQQWRQSQIDSIDSMISQKLAELNLVKKEAWAAWEDSKTVKETTTDESGANSKGEWNKVAVKREKMIGNAVFLSQVLECIKQQSLLMNLPTELKYQDLNAAIAKVLEAGFEITNPVSGEVEAGSSKAS